MAVFGQFRGHVGVFAVLSFVVGVAGCGSSSGARTAAYGGTAGPSPAGTQRTIKVPDSFAEYTRVTSADAERVIQDIRKAQAQQNPVFAAKMKIAVFQRHGDAHQRIAFIGLAAGDHPTIAQELRRNPPKTEVDSALAAMPLSGPKDYPAGPLGGALRCAPGSRGGAGCAWADGSTVGVVAGSAPSADELARTTLALRNAAER
ncbi:hypothetical protein [Actinoallomurus sp. CA-150999]|uniref:hypothetical protein n=1 Tax=Actinoallomurus sp. CA-150999 TaxID=3239887 RepID=UPI003D8F6518